MGGGKGEENAEEANAEVEEGAVEGEGEEEAAVEGEGEEEGAVEGEGEEEGAEEGEGEEEGELAEEGEGEEEGGQDEEGEGEEEEGQDEEINVEDMTPESFLQEYDLNKDGKVSWAEYTPPEVEGEASEDAPAMDAKEKSLLEEADSDDEEKTKFESADADKDGHLSLEEIGKFIAADK